MKRASSEPRLGWWTQKGEADASNAFDGESQLAGCHKPEDDLRQQPDNRKVAIDSRERCRETAPQPTKAAQAAKLKQPALQGPGSERNVLKESPRLLTFFERPELSRGILRVLPLLGGMLAQAGAGTANPGALTLRLQLRWPAVVSRAAADKALTASLLHVLGCDRHAVRRQRQRQRV
ncbi:hypothetical protein AK812_SmicGene45549 [Symbiodinium microadriaticum]|uniref:Uncharacterized protein n=1 Tax=Symbiodinium microadriaticum TaxID=2951 RepID=A0A1Q9BVU0_SYMMI|nr:hypothetical protein AK812_SmicGene45549 [Symbiodinium microadriaticum]